MTGDTAFAERPPEASFDFWQPPRMASQIQRRRAARWTCAAHVPSYVPPPGQDHTKV